MGVALQEQFPFVDLAFSGEADESFPAVLAARRSGAGVDGIRGVRPRRRGYAVAEHAPAARVDDLDSVPVPDFDAFFEQRQRARPAACPANLAHGDGARVLVGRALALHVLRPQRRHDGLPQQDARARRSPRSRRCASATASRRSASWTTSSTCATSAPCSPMLADAGPGPRALLGGQGQPQPRNRCASFATPASCTSSRGSRVSAITSCKLMRKGTTAFRNIELLKWCREYGVKPYLEPALRFPGRDRRGLRGVQPRSFEAIWHLEPPTGYGPIRLDRFSPYHADPGRYSGWWTCGRWRPSPTSIPSSADS